nr:hypothetical protein Iba_chr02cCG3930 [Ipomoea batatas]
MVTLLPKSSYRRRSAEGGTRQEGRPEAQHARRSGPWKGSLSRTRRAKTSSSLRTITSKGIAMAARRLDRMTFRVIYESKGHTEIASKATSAGRKSTSAKKQHKVHKDLVLAHYGEKDLILQDEAGRSDWPRKPAINQTQQVRENRSVIRKAKHLLPQLYLRRTRTPPVPAAKQVIERPMQRQPKRIYELVHIGRRRRIDRRTGPVSGANHQPPAQQERPRVQGNTTRTTVPILRQGTPTLAGKSGAKAEGQPTMPSTRCQQAQRSQQKSSQDKQGNSNEEAQAGAWGEHRKQKAVSQRKETHRRIVANLRRRHRSHRQTVTDPQHSSSPAKQQQPQKAKPTTKAENSNLQNNKNHESNKRARAPDGTPYKRPSDAPDPPPPPRHANVRPARLHKQSTNGPPMQHNRTPPRGKHFKNKFEDVRTRKKGQKQTRGADQGIVKGRNKHGTPQTLSSTTGTRAGLRNCKQSTKHHHGTPSPNRSHLTRANARPSNSQPQDGTLP